MDWVKIKRTVRIILNQPRRLTRSNSVGHSTPRRLHLGCGDVHIPGYCNVDIDPSTKADVIDDILTLRRFPDEFATHIYACHVLEHVGTAQVSTVLRRWRQVLKSGGELRVSVPDVDRIVQTYIDNWEHFQTRGHSPWIGLIYGGQTDPYDFHKTGFNLNWMTYLLEEAGFSDVQDYEHEPHFLGIKDDSLANEPFGTYISLNVRAIKA